MKIFRISFHPWPVISVYLLEMLSQNENILHPMPTESWNTASSLHISDIFKVRSQQGYKEHFSLLAKLVIKSKYEYDLRCLQHEINLRQMTWHVMREHPSFDTLWTLLPFGDFLFLPKTIATPSIMRTMAAMAGHLSQTLQVWRLALKNMTWICWYGWRKKIIGV